MVHIGDSGTCYEQAKVQCAQFHELHGIDMESESHVLDRTPQ